MPTSRAAGVMAMNDDMTVRVNPPKNPVSEPTRPSLTAAVSDDGDAPDDQNITTQDVEVVLTYDRKELLLEAILEVLKEIRDLLKAKR